MFVERNKFLPLAQLVGRGVLLLVLLSGEVLANGWTEFEPSPDARIVYVSSSVGSDFNSGLSTSSPVRTISKGISLLRPGCPDRMLLKRGDVWTNETLGYWNRQGGRSQAEPMLISYYGDPNDPRPLLRTGGESGAKIDGVNSPGSPNHRRVDYLAIIGLHFIAHTYDGTATDSWGIRPAGIRWTAGSDSILIEDCLIEGYATNIAVMDSYGISINNVVIRRNVLVDAYAVSADALDARAQGIYTDGINGLLIEENILDRNGWKEGLPNAEPTIYSHNMYIQYGNWNVVIRGNISARASSHGLQARPGGIVENNLFIDNSIAFFMADGDGDGSDNLAADNVVLHGSRRLLRPDGWPRGWGIDMMNHAGSQCIRNVIAHGTDCTNALTGLAGVYTQDNVIYQWGSQSDPGPFFDPDRTISTYDTLIGGAGTLESFLAQARQMSRFNWNPDYTTAAAIPYFQAGFNLNDADADGVGDSIDNCVSDYNPSQTDSDGDGVGNVCDDDCPYLDGVDPVTGIDYAIFAGDWQNAGPSLPGDIDGDEDSDIDDLALLTAYWLANCTE